MAERERKVRALQCPQCGGALKGHLARQVCPWCGSSLDTGAEEPPMIIADGLYGLFSMGGTMPVDALIRGTGGVRPMTWEDTLHQRAWWQ